MPMYDFECPDCGAASDDVVPYGVTSTTCDACGAATVRVFVGCAKQLTTIIPSYPGCKKKKAGYVHTHGDKDRTRVQGRGFSFPK